MCSFNFYLLYYIFIIQFQFSSYSQSINVISLMIFCLISDEMFKAALPITVFCPKTNSFLSCGRWPRKSLYQVLKLKHQLEFYSRWTLIPMISQCGSLSCHEQHVYNIPLKSRNQSFSLFWEF